MRKTTLRKAKVNYRKIAFSIYKPFCAICGFGVPEILEVAHLDCDRTNNEPSNLCLLCPNCHKMHDVDMIPTKLVVLMRARAKKADWSKRMKDAGRKAADTKKRNRLSKIARKAAATRRRNERKASF